MRFLNLSPPKLLFAVIFIYATAAGSSHALEATEKNASPSEKNLIRTFDEAQILFDRDSERPEFLKYLGGFAEWNNANNLDTRGNCYLLGQETVTLFLVVTQSGGIEQVFAELDSPKSTCFKKSFLGLKWKRPPYFPTVIRMTFD